MDYKNEPDHETKKEWENDPENWIWGMFYYNPKDKRPYFTKRIKEFGWHVNYANPIILIITSLVIALVLILIKCAKFQH